MTRFEKIYPGLEVRLNPRKRRYVKSQTDANGNAIYEGSPGGSLLNSGSAMLYHLSEMTTLTGTSKSREYYYHKK